MSQAVDARPDFFIVGAPKCGTTAMYAYLRQHPQIFMPYHKEPLFFGADLGSRYGRMTRAEYQALFAGARPDQRVGEASAWYLFSASAAAEIHAFAPSAKIIIMLRNPVDVMYAQHSQLLFNRQEDLADFGRALAAEPDRLRGERLPPGAVRAENLYYREMVRFAPQVDRYFREFGRSRVHVTLHDDLRADTPGVYRQVLRFLEVDDAFTPQFEIANPNKAVRLGALQDVLYQPPAAVRRLFPRLRRYRAIYRLRDLLLRANSRPRARPPMDPDLRRRLTVELAPDVAELGALIGRDLSAWSRVE